MRQTTLPEQTAKLIELGFDRPKNRVIKQLLDRSTDSWITIGEEGDYSIGELIEMLPSHIGWCELNIWHIWHLERWVICFDPEKYTSADTELIDAAYNLIVKLKEEGVI